MRAESTQDKTHGVDVGLALWLLLTVCVWIYWPGLDGPPLLDDGANLREIYSLDESRDYLFDLVFGNRAGPLGRPLSMLSFGLEHLYAPDGIWGFKYHNLALHLLIGCLVVWLTLHLLPLLARQTLSGHWSVLVGAFWLLTPMFTSTTLYIVQRMTQMSALFCVLGLLVYVVGRLQLERGLRRGWTLLASVFPCAAAAVLGKENGAVLLPLVVLTEWACWGGRIRAQPGATRALRMAHLMTFATCVASAAVYFGITGRDFLGGYATRDFTLAERLLTQSRALWEYAFHLLLPMREGLGLYHDDFRVSRSLLDPWTTLPAAAGLLAVVTGALWRLAAARGAVAYGILFFLLAHSIESTILPLEMYFEHRNYLPAVGIYLTVTVVLVRLRSAFDDCAPLVFAGVASWLLFAILNTGIQSALWSREVVLLSDAVHQHPGSVRAKASLSGVYARMGAVDMAMRYANEAAALDEPTHLRHTLRRLALLCIADAELPEGVVEELDVRISAASLRDPQVSESLQVLVERVNRGQCPTLDLLPIAAKFRQRLLEDSEMTAAPKVYGMLAILATHLVQFDDARRYLGRWVEREPDSVEGWMIELTLASNVVDRDRALRQLRRLYSEGRVSREQCDDIELLAPGWDTTTRLAPPPR